MTADCQLSACRMNQEVYVKYSQCKEKSVTVYSGSGVPRSKG